MRLAKIIPQLESRQCDAFLITNPTNIKYLTGFSGEDAWLLVTQSGVFFITDARYTQEARAFFKRKLKVVEHQRGLIGKVAELSGQKKIKALGFEPDHMTHAIFLRLKSALPKRVKLKKCVGWVERMRMMKSADEIKCMRKALDIHKQAHQYLKRIIKPQVTEQEVYNKLQQYVYGKGAGFSFRSIIASGPNSALPHAVVTHRKIRKQDLVLVDMGIDVNGYKSDLTRMFFLGKITPKIRVIFNEVLAAQQIAIQAIKPKEKFAHVAQLARNHLAKKGLDQYFVHSLGHGVGCDVHEAPRLSVKSQGRFSEGMVVTVEPGVYLPQMFGIRLEEMVRVTQKGCEVLSDHIH